MKTTSTIEMPCCSCGTLFAMDEALLEMRRKDGRPFFCPNGHGQSFSVSDVSKLKDALKELEENKSELADCKKEITRLRCEAMKHAQERKGFLGRILS